ncbi:hypothetical protein ACLKA6_002181 [Drosophila palustris]
MTMTRTWLVEAGGEERRGDLGSLAFNHSHGQQATDDDDEKKNQIQIQNGHEEEDENVVRLTQQADRQLGQDFQLTDIGRRSTTGDAEKGQEQEELAVTTFDLTMIAGQLAIPKSGERGTNSRAFN